MNFYLPKRRKKTPMKVQESGMIRSPSHLAFVRGFMCSCAAAGATDCEGKIEAAHTRIGTDGGTSLKPSDCWAIPLCSGHHAEQHRIGGRSFETKYGIRMKEIASKLWAISKAGIRYRKEQEGTDISPKTYGSNAERKVG